MKLSPFMQMMFWNRFLLNRRKLNFNLLYVMRLETFLASNKQVLFLDTKRASKKICRILSIEGDLDLLEDVVASLGLFSIRLPWTVI